MAGKWPGPPGPLVGGALEYGARGAYVLWGPGGMLGFDSPGSNDEDTLGMCVSIRVGGTEQVRNCPAGGGPPQPAGFSWQELKVAAEAGFDELLKQQEQQLAEIPVPLKGRACARYRVRQRMAGAPYPVTDQQKPGLDERGESVQPSGTRH